LTTGRLDELLAAGFVEIKVEKLSTTAVEKLKCGCTCTQDPSGCLVVSQKGDQDVNQTLDFIRSQNGRVISVIPQRRTLEDLFVEVIKGADTK
jgi:ABC-2 type transport system ATP-binding protein